MNNVWKKVSVDELSIGVSVDQALFHVTCSNDHILKIPAAENHKEWHMKFPGPIEFTCLKCDETLVLDFAEITIGSY